MLVFKNAFLIDGTGAAPLPNATVIISGKTIDAAGQNIKPPENAQVIDLKGKPLLPGFSDAHTHFGGSPLLERPGSVSRFTSYDYAEHCEAALSWGVTAMRSAGDFTPDIIEFRDEVNAGKHRSPRVLACGPFLQAKGGHPLSTVYFDDPVIAKGSIVSIDEKTDIDAEVGKLADLGVDWIKVMAGRKNKLKYPDDEVPGLTEKQLRLITDAAHKRGLPVMMHADDVGDLVRAVKAGADTVEHTINVATSDHEMTDEALRLLIDNKVWVVPTMTATKLHDGSAAEAPLVWPALLTAVRRMIQAGVRIGVGCDSGIPFLPRGECIHIETELLTEAGYTPLQAVTAVTGKNAEMLRSNDVFGTVTPGKAADIAVLGSNPLEDIRNTRDILMVLRDGAVVIDKLLSV
ncbi:MAG: amidohydrolase family protein [Oscillospiraceae bacterium]|nr:amidohydrolase family protein [Oscillospiraceae bacterium]